jgi:transcriptional regulator with XRE-family HTH domain
VLSKKDDRPMNIGERIRNLRLQQGLSQGDIEKRTGLLRCYLSRIENARTIPSIDTLVKLAQAINIPLAQFFSKDCGDSHGHHSTLLRTDDARFLGQMRRYSCNLSDSHRGLVLEMVKKMVKISGRYAG